MHISFQFKKQCEKSDAKLRQYIANTNAETVQQQEQQQHEQQQQQQQQQPQIQHQPQHIQVTQDISQPPQTNCVYIECAPLIEMQQDQNGFVSAPQINYNVQPQNHIPLGSYSLQTVTPVQVYNGAYTMPLQQMQPTNMLHNQVITSSMPLQAPPQQIVQAPQQIMQPQQQISAQVVVEKEKQKRGGNFRKYNTSII